MGDPFRKLNQAEQKIKHAAKSPQREAAKMQQQAKQAMRAPGQQARQMKHQAMQPGRQMQAQMRSYQSQGRRYKRYGKRMSNTDFMVSAMFYPMGFPTIFAGMMEDWDTEYIRYHLVHARMLWVVMLILFPLLPPTWMYAWFLGFRAYSGHRVRIPILTNWAEKRGKLDIEPAEQQ